MDSKGILNIEFVFTTIITILLLIAILPKIEENLESNNNIETHLNSRLLIDKIANEINQINANNYNYSKEIKLPHNIPHNKNYLVKLKKNEITIDLDNKKGKIDIIPINLVNTENQTIDEIILYPNNTYLIKKLLINKNKTNQSSIQIIRIN